MGLSIALACLIILRLLILALTAEFEADREFFLLFLPPFSSSSTELCWLSLPGSSGTDNSLC